MTCQSLGFWVWSGQTRAPGAWWAWNDLGFLQVGQGGRRFHKLYIGPLARITLARSTGVQVLQYEHDTQAPPPSAI